MQEGSTAELLAGQMDRGPWTVELAANILVPAELAH